MKVWVDLGAPSRPEHENREFRIQRLNQVGKPTIINEKKPQKIWIIPS